MIFTGEARRVEKWQYPMEAICEIVINMIIHRDYRSSSDSIVKIFDNKIEFYNPGRLPDDITVEKLLSGKYKSMPRNKIIAGICKDMQLIEKYGSGIGRVCDYFKKEDLPIPKFENISDGFQVTVFGDAIFNDTVEVQDNSTEKTVEKTVEKIIEIMNGNSQVTIKELVELTGLSRRGVEWNIQQLKTGGLIERVLALIKADIGK